MKLFLTSQAWKVLDLLPANLSINPKETKLGFIANAADVYEDKHWVVDDRKKLEEMDFELVDINIKETQGDDLSNLIDTLDGIFMAGGNVFYLLDLANKSGLTEIMKDKYYDDNFLYIGSSAGSYIAGPDVEGIDVLDDPEVAKLESTEAFGLVKVSVMPHWGAVKKREKKIEQMIKNFDLAKPVILQTDNQALISNGIDSGFFIKDISVDEVYKVLLLPYNDKNEVLLQDRTGYKPPPWGYFGGSIEKGETPLMAVIREAKEELDIDLKPNDLEFFFHATGTLDDGRLIDVNVFTWKTDKKAEDFDLHEGKGLKFCTYDEAMELVVSQRDKSILRRFFATK